MHFQTQMGLRIHSLKLNNLKMHFLKSKDLKTYSLRQMDLVRYFLTQMDLKRHFQKRNLIYFLMLSQILTPKQMEKEMHCQKPTLI